MRSPKQPPKLAMLLLLALLLLCNGVGNVHCARIHENSADLHALLHFKQGITDDPKGALSNWNTTTHFCRWYGVTCNTTRPFRVSWLNLTGQNLQGHITPSIGNLTFLNRLVLSYNRFIGTFPVLSNLQLQYLVMGNNNLTGINPNALSNCSSLSYLDFSSNLLVGVIPPELGFLSNLYYIDLRSNQLEGRTPDELGKLQNLQGLYLGDNRLSGEFPRAILNLSSLQVLSLETNMLGKALPPNIGDLLPNLTQITLGGNTFEGPIPASLGNAAGLIVIDFSTNYFTGKIPTSFGKLANLTTLNLEVNQLEARESRDWEFLNALTNCRYLNTLSLSFNQLQGSIPQSIGNLSSSLEHLLLSENRISGQVPQSIGALSALTKLALNGNNLSGTIEGWVGNLKGLQILNLRSNSFTGIIPSSIGNLTNLIQLYIYENEFEGPIPASLGNLPLLELDLSSNNLQGYIPPTFGNQDFIYLNLSYNNLQGDIPHISNKLIKQLTVLDLSSNKLTGPIPDSLGQCYGLESLQMSQNFLTGNIPSNFGNLTLLSMLNLSHNKLSGTIPLALNRLEANNLDLSYNHLEGEIPKNGIFKNSTSISLVGNWGLCGGAMNLHFPMCPSVSRRSETQYYLVRAVIPIFGFASLVMLTYIIFFGKKTSTRTYSILLSFGKKFPRVTYNDLARATVKFSELYLVGRGNYGSVYRGKLTQAKIQVAIKVFDLDMKYADKSFVTECEVLRRIRHRSLVPILTACSTIDNNGDAFKALIYEFMPNGNLDTWLHSTYSGSSSKCLSLVQRVSIAISISDALAYLHYDCERQIVHCDLKPTNILLDNDMNAFLGDFGIASLIGHSSLDTSMGLKGTLGYIPPEYAQSGQASIHGDVYSFGIVLLEILIGRRPTDPMFENELNIVNFVGRNYPDEIQHIIDARLCGEHKCYIKTSIGTENAAHGCLLSLMQVALSCTRLIPRERMSMREVTNKLHSIQTSYIRATKR